MVKAVDDAKTAQQNAELEQSMKAERDEWHKKLSDLISKLKDPKNLTEAMVFGLSYRQMVVEKLSQYKILVYKKESAYDKMFSERYKKYTIEGDIKYNGTERAAAVKGDLIAFKFQIDLLRTQIEFFQESLNTLNNYQFAVKNRIQIVTEEIM